MRCALNNVLLFCFLSSAVGLASAVNCAPVDRDNTPLTGSQSTGDFVTCTYSGAGPCTYFPLDGSFSSGSSSCPHGLPQGGSGNVSTTTSTAAPPPVTSTSTPPPAPPVTSSTLSVSSTLPAPLPVTSAVVTTTSSTPTTQTSPTASATTSAPSSPPSNAAAPFAANSVLAVMGLAGAVVGINLF